MLALLLNTAANCKSCVHSLRETYFKGTRTNLPPLKGQSMASALWIVLKLLKRSSPCCGYCSKLWHVFYIKAHLSKGDSCLYLLKNFFWKTETKESDFHCAVSVRILLRNSSYSDSTGSLRTLAYLCGGGHSVSMPSHGFSQESLVELFSFVLFLLVPFCREEQK